MTISNPHELFKVIADNKVLRLAQKLKPVQRKDNYEVWLHNIEVLTNEIEIISSHEEKFENTACYLKILKKGFPKKASQERQQEVAERFFDSRIDGIESVATVDFFMDFLSKPVPGSYRMRAREYARCNKILIDLSKKINPYEKEHTCSRLDQKRKRHAERILYTEGIYDLERIHYILGSDIKEVSADFKKFGKET